MEPRVTSAPPSCHCTMLSPVREANLWPSSFQYSQEERPGLWFCQDSKKEVKQEALSAVSALLFCANCSLKDTGCHHLSQVPVAVRNTGPKAVFLLRALRSHCFFFFFLGGGQAGSLEVETSPWPVLRSLQKLKPCCSATQSLSQMPGQLKCLQPQRSSSGLCPKSCCPYFKSLALFKAPVTSSAHSTGSALAAGLLAAEFRSSSG